MRFPFFRNRDSVKNGILISIRRTGDGFHPGLFTGDWISKPDRPLSVEKQDILAIYYVDSSKLNGRGQCGDIFNINK